MQTYNDGLNQGLLIGMLTKGIIVKSEVGENNSLQDISGVEHEILGEVKLLTYVKENI